MNKKERKQEFEDATSGSEMDEMDVNEVSDSEDEYSEEERKLLDKVRQKRQIDNYDSEDEVMGFNNEDDEEKDSLASDIEGLKEDFDLPNEKAWGKKKKAYYSTDYVDADYTSTTREDTVNAEMEEQEARNLQKRLAEQLDEADFGLDLIAPKQDSITEVNEGSEHIKADLSKLSKRQKQELLEKESPEFIPLVMDFKERLTEVKTILAPFLDLIEKANCQDCSATNFVRAKYDLLLNYCTNISFYLILKAKREPTASHPVIKRLAQYRQLLAQLEECQGDLLKQVKEILEANANGQPLYNSKDSSKISLKKKVEELHAKDRSQKPIEKKDKKVVFKKDSSTDEDEHDDLEQEVLQMNDEDSENEIKKTKDEKRAITYQIAKNEGLKPYRKKEQRNPRVKHRKKYRKAKIRRRGAVREVRKEINRYSGEISGIKASVKKSIKLK